MIFVITAGVVGILTPDSPGIVVALNEWSTLWSASLAIAGIAAIVGLAIKAPNGLLINLAAMVVLATSSSSVLIALSVFYANPFFSGSITLYVFTVGSICRGAQIVRQLSRLKAILEKLDWEEK